jgi:hypothetical protein
MGARHLQIASEKGPKAGLNFYLAQNAPTVRERQAQILAAADPLTAYCNLFSEHFRPLSGNGVVVQDERTDDAKQGIIERLRNTFGLTVVDPQESQEDEKAALIAQAEALGLTVVDPDELGVVVEAPAPVIERKTTTRKPRAAKAAPKGALAKGDTFVYHGKNTSRWTILRIKGAKYAAVNERGHESPWKIATVASLIEKGKITRP